MNRLFRQSLPALFQSIVERRARWTIAVTLLITLCLGWALTQLSFENRPGRLDLPLDDPVRLERDNFENRFGGGETVIIGLRFDRPIDARALRLIERLTERYRHVDGVLSVYSLATAADLEWIPAFGVHVLRSSPVVRISNTSGDTALEQSIVRLREHSLHRQNLISEDGRSTAVVLSVDKGNATGASSLEPLKALINNLRRISVEETDGSVGISLVGTPLLNIALEAAMRRDLSIFGPLCLAAFLLILVIIFRSWRPVVAALITALVALVWSVSLLPLTDTPMSVSVSMIVPIVLSLSLVYSIHHITCVCRADNDGGRESRPIKCWRMVTTRNVLCGITTCVGFLSLAISQLPGIREVGIFMGLGVVSCTVLANLFLPAMLTFLTPEAGWHQSNISERFVARFIPKLEAAVLGRPYLFIVVIVAVTVGAAAGVYRLRVETNHLSYLARDKEITESFEFVNTEFGGVLPLEILIDIPRQTAASTIPLIVDLEDSLRAVDGIGSVISAADFIMRAEQSKPDGTVPLRPPLHLDKGFVPNQIWDLVGGTGVNGRYVDRNDSVITMRISSRAQTVGSERLRSLLRDVNGFLNRHFSDYGTTVTGLAPYFARVERYLVSTQIDSFAVALVVVITLLAVLSGSLRTGLAVVAVNIIPIAAVLGIMGWLGIPLDISTVMIAAIAIGIVVDDTIHLLYTYKRERLKGTAVDTSLQRAFSEVGLAVLTTTIILTVGFGSLLPARFIPTAYFGGLSALTVLTAAVADILLLPALILVLNRKSGKSTADSDSG